MELTTVRQLKKLQSIQPEKKWVKATKEQLLAGEHYYVNEPAIWDVFGILRKSWVLSSVVAVLVIATGFFAFMSYNNKMFVNDLLARLNTANNSNQKQLVSSLEEMKGNLETIKSSMDNLRLAKNKKEALVMASVVKATAKNGKATVQSIKSSDGSAIDGKVLASLNETEKQFQDMENMVLDVQKEFIASLITDLKTRSLTARNQDLLKKAEEDYKNGKIEEAAMEISWISQ